MSFARPLIIFYSIETNKSSNTHLYLKIYLFPLTWNDLSLLPSISSTGLNTQRVISLALWTIAPAVSSASSVTVSHMSYRQVSYPRLASVVPGPSTWIWMPGEGVHARGSLTLRIFFKLNLFSWHLLHFNAWEL